MRKCRTNRNVTGQILVLGSQAIKNPGAHAGTNKCVTPGVQLQQRPPMTRIRTMHGIDNTQIVDVPRNVGKQITHPGPRSTVLSKSPRRFKQSPCG